MDAEEVHSGDVAGFYEVMKALPTISAYLGGLGDAEARVGVWHGSFRNMRRDFL